MGLSAGRLRAAPPARRDIRQMTTTPAITTPQPDPTRPDAVYFPRVGVRPFRPLRRFDQYHRPPICRVQVESRSGLFKTCRAS